MTDAERQAVVWKSGIASVLALLQTDVDVGRIQELVEKKLIDGAKRIAGLVLLAKLVRHTPDEQMIAHPIAWFTTALRANRSCLTHYLDDLSGLGTHMEVLAGEAFFSILERIATRLSESTNERQVLRMIDALMWNYSSANHRPLLKMNLFKLLREGNGRSSNLIKRSWGRPPPSLVVKPVEKSITEASFDAFETLFTLVMGRIAEPDAGADLVINKKKGYEMTSLAKAHYRVVGNDSEELLSQAFDVIFGELDRYANLLDAFDGLDWESFARQRNEDRRTKEDAKPVWMVEIGDLCDQSADPLDPKEKAK